jgi:multisubunit Na+/H+ antiporter MnhB subunit
MNEMSVLTRAIARLLLPATIMVALAVLVKGYADTGDGFSAGLIASLGVLVQYVAFGPALPSQMAIVRHANSLSRIGLLIALSVAFVPVLFGKPVLTHWPGPGRSVKHLGTLEFMTPVLFDIGVFMLVIGFVVGVINLIAQTIEREST